MKHTGRAPLAVSGRFQTMGALKRHLFAGALAGGSLVGRLRAVHGLRRLAGLLVGVAHVAFAQDGHQRAPLGEGGLKEVESDEGGEEQPPGAVQL